MTREEIIQAIRNRRAIYVQKRSQCNPFSAWSADKHERMSHTIEAFDILLAEIGEEP